jgi:hypothetical protein
MRSAAQALGVALAAVLLSILFWEPLWTGGGLIGGDTYPYFFPQKTTYADSLAHGELPFWNHLVSLGYPQFAESQTGVLYPLNLVLYRALGVNAAYNASHLIHYIAAYVFTWLLARRLGLGAVGAHLTAVTFVYGWFPPRACLEWAIIGGTYFPLLLWCAESYLQTARLRWLAIAALALGMFLNAGHYNLAWIALLTTGAYVAGRLFWAKERLDERIVTHRFTTLIAFAAAIFLGFALAAPQLLSTAELKSLSQREAFQKQTYGYIPPWYLTQVFWPLIWYGPDVNPDLSLWSSNWLCPPEGTNKIEAHLYFGVVPFYLLLIGGIVGYRQGASLSRRAVILTVLALAAVVLSTGWPILWLRALPGFGFFAGPGRYGIITTIAVALGAGSILDAMLARLRFIPIRGLVVVAVFGLTVWDLWNVSRWVTNVAIVENSPLVRRNDSPLRKLLAEEPQPVRLLAPGPNLPTLTGLNCAPEYLGIGPAAYYDPQRAIPPLDEATATEADIQRRVDWLRRNGITHLLRFEPLDRSRWPVDAPQPVLDPFLNACWGRPPEPLLLYRLQGSRPRAFLESDQEQGFPVRMEGANAATIEVDSLQGGNLTLLELAYPGWSVTIDGQRAEPRIFEDTYQSVAVPAGQHTVTWRFRPIWWSTGLAISAAALALLIAWMLLSANRQRSRAARPLRERSE